MNKYGLKLGTVDTNYIPEVIRLLKDGACDYLELFVVPGTTPEHIRSWAELKGEFGLAIGLHAPHYLKGLNLSLRQCLENNLKMAEEVKKVAEALDPQYTIYHPGVGGDEKETAYELNKIKDKRTLIENKPYYAIGENTICVGHSPEGIKSIMEGAGVGFCLDFGHAICAANALHEDKMAFLKRFLALRPRLFHLTDGDYQAVRDQHKHFGEGDYDLKMILRLIPPQSMVTIETDKNYPDKLDDFARDIKVIKGIEAEVNKG